MFSQEGRTHLAYELHVTNFQPVNVTVLALRLQGHAAPLAAYEGAELHKRMTRVGSRNDDATPQVLAPGQRAVIHLWIEPPQMSDLASVTNIIDVEVQRPAGPDRISVQHVVTSRQFQLPLTVGPPLNGGHCFGCHPAPGRERAIVVRSEDEIAHAARFRRASQ